MGKRRIKKRRGGIEPSTSQSAIECSTTELPAHLKRGSPMSPSDRGHQIANSLSPFYGVQRGTLLRSRGKDRAPQSGAHPIHPPSGSYSASRPEGVQCNHSLQFNVVLSSPPDGQVPKCHSLRLPEGSEETAIVCLFQIKMIYRNATLSSNCVVADYGKGNHGPIQERTELEWATVFRCRIRMSKATSSL